MYNIGTVTTTANSTKVTGTNTKWKENINGIQPQQVIQIVVGGIVYNSSIQSIESDTALTLNFPFHTAVKDAKYVILTTMVNSVSSAANYIVALNTSNMQFSDILTRWMTEQGIITVTLPDQTTQQLRTTKEMDKQLDGKFDKTGGDLNGPLKALGAIQTSQGEVTAHVLNGAAAQLNGQGDIARLRSRSKDGIWYDHVIPNSAGTLAQVGDFGFGANRTGGKDAITISNFNDANITSVYKSDSSTENARFPFSPMLNMTRQGGNDNSGFCVQIQVDTSTGKLSSRGGRNGGQWSPWIDPYSPVNTTKDTQGNIKVASPIVKLFADDIELNYESEGVEMEHLGVGHYLIKGVVGFNADGAWGINNGFVIPQDHNGKNMVLIDYEVRPDGDIEIFVFHQQNADMPERFQNKRIKDFDEDGQPIYFENYEPCDVPESRWIDMRVEMPPNSIYNQKQAEAERLAKIEAERLAQEEAKRIAEEAERAEQEAAERKQYGLDENSVLL
ncbi:hypothetical protein ABN303_19565 [Providencia rettgeri]